MEPDTRKRNYGFLTPLMREHLLTRNDEEPTYNNEKEREKAQGKRKQNDYQITRHAKQALKDLALVSSAYTEKKNRDIFSIDDLRSLLSAIICKIGRDTTLDGPYYNVLIYTIIKTLNSDLDKSHTYLNYQIIENLLSLRPIDIPDETDRRLRRYNQSRKK